MGSFRVRIREAMVGMRGGTGTDKNKTGRTPNRYLIDYRLGIAARLLLTTKLSVAEIGYSCGFNTLSHFNRLFRESKGCTPSEFRERF